MSYLELTVNILGYLRDSLELSSLFINILVYNANSGKIQS